jgi:hypothetical protein
MRLLHPKASSWLAHSRRFIPLGVITLLLLTAPARGQSAWPPPDAQTSLPGEAEARQGNCFSPDLRTPVRGPGFPQPRLGKPSSPAAPGWVPALSPLPPASAFSLQTNLRQYLETWPTPGTTGSDDWPEANPDPERYLE